jgi:DNA gyrase subunit A
VRRRFEHELRKLREASTCSRASRSCSTRFDEAIQIIRSSDGKRDAAREADRSAFDLDEIQTDAILETRLYKPREARDQLILAELGETYRGQARIEALLSSRASRAVVVVRDELRSCADLHADKRRTKILGERRARDVQRGDFIVAEDANVILTREGWLKRLREVTDSPRRACARGLGGLAVAARLDPRHGRASSRPGRLLQLRIDDVPASTSGYGDPVQKLFKLRRRRAHRRDVSFDPRVLPEALAPPSEATSPSPRSRRRHAATAAAYGSRCGTAIRRRARAASSKVDDAGDERAGGRGSRWHGDMSRGLANGHAMLGTPSRSSRW